MEYIDAIVLATLFLEFGRKADFLISQTFIEYYQSFSTKKCCFDSCYMALTLQNIYFY